MISPYRAKLAVLIVSYGNPLDVSRCLKSLAQSTWKEFEVFICENGGQDAFRQLIVVLTEQTRVLEQLDSRPDEIDKSGGRLAAVETYQLSGAPIPVRIAAATENLGYAGGVNAWVERFLSHSGWEAILALNPDTQLGDTCLSELIGKAAEGFGMVGGTLVFDDEPNKIVSYGLKWSRMTGRVIAVGRNSPAGSTPPSEVLAKIDAISGACVLVTRAFIEEIGLMAEDYFLYMEDLEWGQRRGLHRIGFAQNAVIRHVGGTTIGSAVDPKNQSLLSVYLTARNSILHSRRWAGWRWAVHFLTGILYAARHLLQGSPYAAKFTLVGLIDGAKGKTGRPHLLNYRGRK
jgi:GT2 family glycosyltransferase